MAMGGRRFSLLLAAVALFPPAAGTAAPPTRPQCQAVAFSPAFGRDRTVFCATVDPSGTFVWKSTDRGRTWERRGRVGVGADPAVLTGLLVSPLYEKDRRVYVTAGALYGSGDDARTFEVVSDRGETRGRLRAYADSWPSPPGTHLPAMTPHVSLVHASNSVLGQAFVHDSVHGERESDTLKVSLIDFVLPRDFATKRTAVAVAVRQGVTAAWQEVQKGGVVMYRCDVDFRCTDPIQELDRIVPTATEPIDRPGHEYVFGWHVDTKRFQVWRTVDDGYTWRRWTSVERIVDKPETLHMTLTAAADNPRRMYLHVVSDERLGNRKAAHFSLYRSGDGGTSWRLLGASYKATQRGVPRSTLPWSSGGRSPEANGAFVSAQPGGYVYVVAARQHNGLDDFALWCSRDAGVTWRTSC